MRHESIWPTPLKIMDHLLELLWTAHDSSFECIADGIAAAETPRNYGESLFVTVLSPYRSRRSDPFRIRYLLPFVRYHGRLPAGVLLVEQQQDAELVGPLVLGRGIMRDDYYVQ